LYKLQWKKGGKEEDYNSVFYTKRHKDEVEQDIKVMGMKNRQAMDRNSQAWRKTVLKANVCKRQ